MGLIDILTSSGTILLATLVLLWTFWVFAMVWMINKIKIIVWGE